jgi:hypothetical protein
MSLHPFVNISSFEAKPRGTFISENAIAVFSFRNISNKPIWISKVETSCGCTTPEWSTELIQPGKKGYIRVKFDSKGKEGKLKKSITAYCNTLPAENRMGFKVEVLPKK